MSKHEGRTLSLLHKLGGAIARLKSLGVQQVEADAIGGLQHIKWSDPDLRSVLKEERELIETHTPTGLRGAAPLPALGVIARE